LERMRLPKAISKPGAYIRLCFENRCEFGKINAQGACDIQFKQAQKYRP